MCEKSLCGNVRVLAFEGTCISGPWLSYRPLSSPCRREGKDLFSFARYRLLGAKSEGTVHVKSKYASQIPFGSFPRVLAYLYNKGISDSKGQSRGEVQVSRRQTGAGPGVKDGLKGALHSQRWASSRQVGPRGAQMTLTIRKSSVKSQKLFENSRFCTIVNLKVEINESIDQTQVKTCRKPVAACCLRSGALTIF